MKKGDWKVTNRALFAAGCVWIEDSEGHGVAIVDEDVADLMAAAPEQNQALSEIDHWLMANPNVSNDPQLHIIHIHIQYALAKAEGREE